MRKIKIWGIKNCDTMKKALSWLDENGISYDFHDYKKQGVDKKTLQKALDEYGWEIVLNKRGTTWRKLSDKVKEGMNDHNAIDIAIENPSIIKRPILIHENHMIIGFSTEKYAEFFNGVNR